MEGNLSQNCDKGQNCCFMKCRKLNFEKMQKVSLFYHKIKVSTYIKILRHLSLHIDVIYTWRKIDKDAVVSN